MAELFRTKRAARKYLDQHGGVLLDFGTAGAAYSGSFYNVKDKINGGLPDIDWQQTYGVCDFDEAVEYREENGGEEYLHGLIGYDETRLRRARQKEDA